MGVQMRNSTIVAASSLYLGVPYKVLWTLAGALIFSMIKSKKKKKKKQKACLILGLQTPQRVHVGALAPTWRTAYSRDLR